MNDMVKIAFLYVYLLFDYFFCIGYNTTNRRQFMQINKEFLKSLKPCADRYKVFLKHHANFDGSLSEFMGLPDLDYDDKIWIARKVLIRNQLVKWATLCAESVVPVFEAKYPDDKRLSDCINFLKTVNNFNILTYAQLLEVSRHISATNSARFVSSAACVSSDSASAALAVYFAVYAANYAYATYATEADYAAAYTAHYAIEAATYATESAKDAGKDDDAAQQNQEALNIKFLKQVISL